MRTEIWCKSAQSQRRMRRSVSGGGARRRAAIGQRQICANTVLSSFLFDWKNRLPPQHRRVARPQLHAVADQTARSLQPALLALEQPPRLHQLRVLGARLHAQPKQLARVPRVGAQRAQEQLLRMAAQKATSAHGRVRSGEELGGNCECARPS